MASAIAAKLAALKKQQAAIEKEMKSVAKTAFKEMSAGVFESSPNLLSFGWTQYTPYWNDGDTCTFSSNSEYPTIVFTAEDGKVVKSNENYGQTELLDEDGEVTYEVTDDAYDKQIEKISSKVTKFLSNFSDDDFLTMFGDHQEITVNRNGKIEIEEYEHD